MDGSKLGKNLFALSLSDLESACTSEKSLKEAHNGGNCL